MLVADTLEGRLNEKLQELQKAKEKLQKLEDFDDKLTKDDSRRLQQLARNFPSVWNHPKADPKPKKRVLREAIQEVIVQHEPKQQRLECIIHWKGGAHSRLHTEKRATPIGSKADPSLVKLTRELATELSDAEIARILNMKKLPTPRGLQWTQERVQSFRKKHRIYAGKRRSDPESLTMNEAMAYLGIGHNALLGLVKRGVLSPNQITEFAPWRVARAELDSEDVQRLVRVLKGTGRLPRGGYPKNQLDLFDDQ